LSFVHVCVSECKTSRSQLFGLQPLIDASNKLQQHAWSHSQAWEGHPSTSSCLAPDRHLSWTFSWSHLETSPRSP